VFRDNDFAERLLDQSERTHGEKFRLLKAVDKLEGNVMSKGI
jgi:hypothetical protein